jgi:hypothetical protein
MTIMGVLWRFALTYVAAALAAGYIVRALGIESGSWLNIGILIGCTLWVCTGFGKENRRFFTPSEKAVVVIGLLAIDLALQFLVMIAGISQKPSPVNSNAVLFAMVVVGLLHAVGIYVFVGLAGKSLVKQGVIQG